ncbi:hypothetical protein ABT275_42635, partial [Streptomyces sp. NPDC001185]|uniref:hypothetical protein n=1 Tax=Streptomyces sp. NPDC001185 TaxID=3154380 RepID=UPI0033331DD3
RSAGDGVSTYLALIFGTLLSSQGTDASFVLTLSGFPPGASLRSCVSDSIRPFPYPISSALSRFRFRVSLSGDSDFTRSAFRSVSGRNSIPVAVGWAFAYSRLAAFFRRVRLYQKLLTGLASHSVLNYREVLLGITFTRS